MAITPPSVAQKLAALIAEAKASKVSKADMLEPYMAVLLKERKAGTSVRIMVGSLASMGVNISEESLRLWFTRSEVTKPPKSAARQPAIVPVQKHPAVAVPTVPALGPRVARADI